MDEISEKLSEILNDPDSMNKVRAMAESLLSGPKTEDSEKEKFNFLNSEDTDSAVDMQRLIKIFSKLNSAERDSRCELLLALKPHLSEGKRKKVDSAVKILKLLELWPIIKESGLIEL